MRSWLLSLAVTAAVVTGCQPVNDLGTYGVEERAVFDDGGRTVEVVVRVRCRILEFPHAPEEARFGTRDEGSPVVLARPDGSVLVVEQDSPCRWEQMPQGGETADLLQPASWETAAAHHGLQGLLFDDSRRPTRVSQLDLVAGSDGLRLVSLTATVGQDEEPSDGFRAAFPAWRPSDSHAPDFPALMERDRWVYVWSHATPLPQGACEGEESRVVQDREQLPACTHDLLYGGDDSVLMNAAPDAGFARVELAPAAPGRRGPDRFPVVALRRADAPTLEVENGMTWAPEVCVPGVCAPPESVIQGAFVLDMTGRRVISINLHGNTLSHAIESRLD